MSNSSEPVGYGRPPKQHRFKKGQSGNPSGRPKAKPSMRFDLENELAQMTSSEDGNGANMTKSRALVKALVSAALNGDMRAMTMILSFTDKTSGSDSDHEVTSDEDQEIINDFINRIK